MLAAGLSRLTRLGLVCPCNVRSCPTGHIHPDTTPPPGPPSVCCPVQDVDWEANPAAGIFSRCDDSFLVARRGLMLTEYGKVDARKAKARLLHGGSSGVWTRLLSLLYGVLCSAHSVGADNCVSAGGASSNSEASLPVDPQEVEDFDAFTQKFWAALKSRTRKVREKWGSPSVRVPFDLVGVNQACGFVAPDQPGQPASKGLCKLLCTQGSIDLDELEEGSVLEMCYVLGKLQEKGEKVPAESAAPHLLHSTACSAAAYMTCSVARHVCPVLSLPAVVPPTPEQTPHRPPLPLHDCVLHTGMELDPSAKHPKGDLDILRRLPVMRLSMIVQRLLDMERQNSRRLKEVASGLLQAIRDKGEEGLKEDDEAVVAAAAQLESN